MSEYSALAKAICHDVVESNICELAEQHEKYLLVRQKVDAILEAYPEYDYRKLQARIASLEQQLAKMKQFFDVVNSVNDTKREAVPHFNSLDECIKWLDTIGGE